MHSFIWFQPQNASVSCFTDGVDLIHAHERTPFDIILLDPPYEAGLLEPVLERIAGFDILSPHGIIVAEHPHDRVMPELPKPYVLYRTYRYGRIALTIWHRAGDERDEETT